MAATKKPKKTTAEKVLAQFIALAIGPPIDAYDEAGAKRKADFHRLGRNVAKQLAEALGLEKGTYDIRSNLGGIAVCGEVTLHGENIYVQLGQTPVVGHRFMYRRCGGRQDYSGGPNRWLDYKQLADLSQAAEMIKRGVI